jgi:hypothetical protein
MQRLFGLKARHLIHFTVFPSVINEYGEYMTNLLITVFLFGASTSAWAANDTPCGYDNRDVVYQAMRAIGNRYCGQSEMMDAHVLHALKDMGNGQFQGSGTYYCLNSSPRRIVHFVMQERNGKCELESYQNFRLKPVPNP